MQELLSLGCAGSTSFPGHIRTQAQQHCSLQALCEEGLSPDSFLYRAGPNQGGPDQLQTLVEAKDQLQLQPHNGVSGPSGPETPASAVLRAAAVSGA